jgi:hypothetical protein
MLERRKSILTLSIMNLNRHLMLLELSFLDELSKLTYPGIRERGKQNRIWS